jgi:hypothetical protein
MSGPSFGRRFVFVWTVALVGLTAGAALPSTAAVSSRAASSVRAAAAAPADTRLGINVDDVAQSAGVVFTDAMKQAAPWSSERALSADGDGNVRQLSAGQVARTIIYPFAPYPSGDYTLLYDGTGQIEVDPNSGSITRAAGGRAVVHVIARPGYGIRLLLTSTDPANYVRNVRLIVPGFESSYQNAPFAPAFLAGLASFPVLRFVHWSHGDISALPLSWQLRPSTTQFTQAGPTGVAWEYQIALANAVGADPWFVIPAGATNFYITQLAALVHARLDPRLHPMFEYADGAWRAGSPTNAYAVMAGRNFHLAGDAQAAAVAWYAQRSTQMDVLVDEVFGADAGRVVRVLGGAAAAPGSAAEALDRTILATAGAAQRADVFAIDATGAAPAALAATRSLLAGTRLELIASGGAVGFSSEPAVASATRAALETWRAAGGGLLAASSVNGYLSAVAALSRLPVGAAAQVNTVRDGVLAAYARLHPTARLAARPLAAQSVLAPIAYPNTYIPAQRSTASLNPAATDVIAINAGGPATSPFAADEFYTSSGTYSYTTGTAVSTAGVTNPAPAAVYQSQRTAVTGFPITYTLPGLTAGSAYTVRLHFAELYFKAAGQRVFNVAINGASVLANFDVYKASGGAFRAVVESFSASANAAGQIVITLTAVTNNPIINGLEVQTGGGGGGPTPTPTPTPTVGPTPPGSPADVTTFHNDALRTGWNASETILNTTNVASSAFGLRRILGVDGIVMAQPLFVANYAVNGSNHNLLIVATEHNSVYAFDADSGAVLWHTVLGPSQSSPDVGCTDIQPEYGITSTPVINRANGTIYVIFNTESSAKVLTMSLGALDLGSGSTKLTPVVVSASAIQSNGARISFSPVRQQNRASLLLANNSLYVGIGSHCEFGTTTDSGWLLQYSASNLAQTAAFNTIEDSAGYKLGSIWGSGFGPAADAQGNIYTVTGNGAFDASSGGHNYSMSVLRFGPNIGGGVQDWFAYSGEASDSNIDMDFGASGVMLLPTQSGNYPNLLIAAGKTANLYVLNRSNLGHYSSTNAGALQVLFPGGYHSTGNGIWGGPAYYNGPNGPTIFYENNESPMKSFALATGGGTPQLSNTGAGPGYNQYYGVTPSVSSNGRAAGTGVVWGIRAVPNGSANASMTLDAYDAGNVSRRLFEAPAGVWTHVDPNAFVTPLVANGKVYAGGYKTVYVFGLAP